MTVRALAIALAFAVAPASAERHEPRDFIVLLSDGRPSPLGAYGPMTERECFHEVMRARGDAACVTRRQLGELLRQIPGSAANHVRGA